LALPLLEPPSCDLSCCSSWEGTLPPCPSAVITAASSQSGAEVAAACTAAAAMVCWLVSAPELKLLSARLLGEPHTPLALPPPALAWPP